MTDLFFACEDCKTYVDGGGRWAYWKLEQAGIVHRGQPVNVLTVLAADKYWNPPKDEDSRWLYEGVFPSLHEFLHDHTTHRILFGEKDDFAPFDGTYFDWMQTGYLLMPSPRYLAEVLEFRSWGQVREYMEKHKPPPAWWEVTWGDPSPHERAKRKFEELVTQK